MLSATGKKTVRKFFDDSCEMVMYLFSRWLDEFEHEDIAEYGEVIGRASRLSAANS